MAQILLECQPTQSVKIGDETLEPIRLAHRALSLDHLCSLCMLHVLKTLLKAMVSTLLCMLTTQLYISIDKSLLLHVTREFHSVKLICRNLYAIVSHVKKAYTANQNGV